MAELLEQLVHLPLVAAGFQLALAPPRADTAALAIQLETGETRLVYQVDQLRWQTMNKLRAKFHRQVALNGLNGMNPSTDAFP